MRQRQLDIVYSFFREYIYAISYGHLKATTEMVAAIDTLRQRVPDLRLGGRTEAAHYNIYVRA